MFYSAFKFIVVVVVVVCVALCRVALSLQFRLTCFCYFRSEQLHTQWRLCLPVLTEKSSGPLVQDAPVPKPSTCHLQQQWLWTNIWCSWHLYFQQLSHQLQFLFKPRSLLPPTKRVCIWKRASQSCLRWRVSLQMWWVRGVLPSLSKNQARSERWCAGSKWFKC